NLFPLLDNPELTIRRRSRAYPTLLNDFEMATEGNDDPPVPDLQTMEELCQPSLNGRGGPIAPTHLDKFLHVTQSIKVNGVTDDALHLYLFPYSLTRHATTWFDSLPRNSINTFEQMAKMFLGKYFPPSMVTKLRNEITNFRQRPDESLCEAWEQIVALKAKMAKINKNLMKVLQINHQVKEVTPSCETCGGPHSYNDCPAIIGQIQNVYAAGAYQGDNSYQPQGASHGQNPPPAYQAPAYQAPVYQAPVHQPPIPQPQVVTTTEFTNYMKENDAILKNMQTNMISLTNPNLELQNMFVERETKVTKEMVPPTNNESTKDVQPLVVQVETPILNSEPVVAPVNFSTNWCRRRCLRKSGKVPFPDFVVVDFDADPRVPLILERSFLKTRKALIDVYEGELTPRVGKKAITFNIDQTSRYSANYNDMTANQIDVIDMACEKYSQEVLGFFNVIASGNPTPYYDPIVSTSSPTLTLFGDSDFLLKEVDAFLALENDPTSPEVDHSYYDTEWDILLLEAFFNDDPSLPPPTQGMYFPQVRKELKLYEAKNDKSSIDEPPEVELKDLPPHLEYAFLEGDDKLPVIISKDLSVEEKSTPIKVLKSHKQAIALKISDIKGINPEFCTHKILMEDDFEPASFGKPRTLRTKKGGFTVVENEENELIPTRLVKGWRVCIDYHKLNEATRKDHFPLLFMDQMIEGLAGNEYYCFLDGFSGAENLAANHLSRLENPHQCVLGKKEINETFPLETLNMVSFRGDSSTLWKPLTFSRLATMDPLRDTMARTTPLKRFGTPRAIISDRGTHFCNDQFAKVMLKYGVTHRLSTAYHPQTSGQVEVSNHG
nr:reverse transcriptase domain-containing protein [Tanacetum cinerariifolium]